MTRNGVELVKSFEGFRANAYWDATGKVWTIGYGATYYPETGAKVQKGDVVSKERATEMLYAMLESFQNKAMACIKVELAPNQIDALTSFAYNVGIGNFKKSTLLKKVNADPSDQSIRQEFAKWNKSGGKVLAGLTRRRKAEADLYFTPYDNITVSEEKKNELTDESSLVLDETDSENERIESDDTVNEIVMNEEKPERIPWYRRFWIWVASIFWRD